VTPPTLFPEGVELVLLASSAEPAPLLGAEVESAARMRPDRRKEFALGRTAARLALARLGRPAVVLPRDPRGMALWPDGFVGTIAHAAGLIGAAAGRAGCTLSLGLDLEPRGELHPEVAGSVFAPEESARLAGLCRADRDDAALVSFCAKEALFKCWFPLIRQELEPRDVVVQVDFEEGRVRADIPDQIAGRFARGDRFEVRFARTDDHILVGVALRRE
jgi:4'-phosphopantetheinyl transferase EntD